MSDAITRLYPPRPSGAVPDRGPDAAGGLLSDDDLLALYAFPGGDEPWVRANFVSSIDGSASSAGVSAGLGGPADKRVFDLLRQLSDVVLVAAGTVRAEGYGALRLDDAAAAWRVARGLPAQPAFAIVSGSLDLDPDSEVFTQAPRRPILLTAQSADAGRRGRLGAVADVVTCGAASVDPARMIAELAARGLRRIHCEGGPSLLGSLVAADRLDALCLTTSPTLEGGAGGRISHSPAAPELRAMGLDHLLLAGDMTLALYSRRR